MMTGLTVSDTAIDALPPRVLVTTAVPLYVPTLKFETLGETTTMSPSKLTRSQNDVPAPTESAPRSANVPPPTFDARAVFPGGEIPAVAENVSTLGVSAMSGGGFVTAKFAVNVALPPFVLRTVTVAEWLPAGTFAGVAPMLMTEPVIVASSQPVADALYAMLAMVIAPSDPPPRLEIAIDCRGGEVVDRETPANERVVGERLSTGAGTSNLAVTVVAWVTVTEHEPDPVHAPPHDVNRS